MNYIKTIFIRIRCYFWYHDYTCAMDEWISPTKESIKSVFWFFDYCKMYCKDCKHIYVESKRLMLKAILSDLESKLKDIK